jgi:hypothetical protein
MSYSSDCDRDIERNCADHDLLYEKGNVSCRQVSWCHQHKIHVVYALFVVAFMASMVMVVIYIWIACDASFSVTADMLHVYTHVNINTNSNTTSA